MPKIKLEKYLRKYATLRPLISGISGAQKHPPISRAVVIPAMGEAQLLPRTLHSLAGNPEHEMRKTEVLVVINQPQTPMRKIGDRRFTKTAVAENNAATLDWLAAHQADFAFDLSWIDAASAGQELPGEGGVGMARRVGCDSLLQALYATDIFPAAATAPDKFVLLHLDADTTVAPNYLARATQGIMKAGTDGGVVNFRHQRPTAAGTQAGIDVYEAYLRYFVTGLRAAGSPYAFHTIGSTMVCTVAGYVKAGGISAKRKAGEDFYFLQQLAKTGGVCEIVNTKVYPSARLSARNPYGTGPSIEKILGEGPENYKTYSPECFRAVKQWLTLVAANINASPEVILDGIQDPAMRYFVKEKGFEAAWLRIKSQHQDHTHRLRAFHEWFDALATIRLIRHLSRTAYPPIPLAEAIAVCHALFDA